MVSGGLAMIYSAGHAGPDVRADVRIVAEAADSFSFTYESSVQALYGVAIVRQVHECAVAWGSPPVRLHAEDSGALPFTWQARLAAVFAQCGCPPPSRPVVLREPRHRRRRSRLYVPGDTPKLLLNATLCPADAFVFDLEDAVPADRKTDALWLVDAALRTLDYGHGEVSVRINAGQAGIDEATFLCGAGVEAFWVPKCEQVEDILALDQALSSMGSPALLVLLIESAVGVENAYHLVRCCPRIVAASLGVEDYLRDVRAERTEGQAESAWARGRVLNAAVAAGVMPLASVYPRFEDLTAVTAYARSARAAGYRGVGCIHPAQIEAVHAGFAPSADEVEHARRVVEAFDASGHQAVAVDGRMVDEPVYLHARQTLSEAEEAGA